MKRAEILDKAQAAVKERSDSYGTPENNFERIATLWEAHLLNRIPLFADAIELLPSDVAIMLAMVKIARLENDPTHADSWIDLAGYAACGGEVSPAPTRMRGHTIAKSRLFYIGETVNTVVAPSGSNPGIVTGFTDDGQIMVRWTDWQDAVSDSYNPECLRHVP